MQILIESCNNRIINTAKNKIKKFISTNNKDRNANATNYKNIISICTGIISIIFIYPIVSSAVINYGSYIGDVVMKKYSPNKINYEFNKDNNSSDEKDGIVVAQQGDTYYISQLPERKLVIIKSKSIVVD